MKQFIYLFLIVIFSCEKDDICSDTKQTTPRIVLEFYNNESPEDTLDVPELLAVGLDRGNTEIPITNELIMPTKLFVNIFKPKPLKALELKRWCKAW